jgi:hydrogenase nickel incorporation protein HypA/HybF
MHEMAICESIRQTIEELATSQSFSRVGCVRLEVGRFSGVEPEALRFGFDAVMRGSIAEGARLEIVDCPAEAWCMQCAATVPVLNRFDPCNRCGSHQLQVTSGEQLRIKDLEVD